MIISLLNFLGIRYHPYATFFFRTVRAPYCNYSIPWQHQDYQTITALSLGLCSHESGQLSPIIPQNHGITITYYIPSPLTVHFPITHSMRYQSIFHTLFHATLCMRNVVLTTTVIEMVEILDESVGKHSVEQVRYVINNLLHSVIVKYGVISLSHCEIWSHFTRSLYILAFGS